MGTYDERHMAMWRYRRMIGFDLIPAAQGESTSPQNEGCERLSNLQHGFILDAG